LAKLDFKLKRLSGLQSSTFGTPTGRSDPSKALAALFFKIAALFLLTACDPVPTSDTEIGTAPDTAY